MITIVVIADPDKTAKALSVMLPADRFRLSIHGSIEDAEPALDSGVADAVILETDLTDVSGARRLAALAPIAGRRPVFVVAARLDPEWEEEAVTNGVRFVFRQPLRAGLLQAVIERTIAGGPSVRENSTPHPAAGPAEPARQAADRFEPDLLGLLRDFSRLLGHRFDTQTFLSQFLLKLREVISVSRVALFMRPPSGPFGALDTEGARRRLICRASIGLPPDLFKFLELSLDSGIGATVTRSGQILKSAACTRSPFPTDSQVEREFELLGGHIAVPVFDRERTLGVAVLGPKITDTPFENSELQLLFHLMEELGLTLKNSRLHDNLVAHHRLISGIIDQMGSGCLVVSRDLRILESNPAARRIIPSSQSDRPLEFSELPQLLASSIYQVLHRKLPHDELTYTPETAPDTLYQVSTVPFYLEDGDSPSAALTVLENHTPYERARRAEIEVEKSRLLSIMAERFAHEIRNALISINTHRQLLPESIHKPEFQESLRRTLDTETSRVLRCADQLLYVSRHEMGSGESIELHGLCEEALKRAIAASRLEQTPDVSWPDPWPDVTLAGDRAGLSHALFEIFLNALQSSANLPGFVVAVETDSNPPDTAKEIRIGVTDHGGGFPEAIAAKSFDAFFTTRNVGMGLGLTVARKLVLDHGGQVEIYPRPHGELGDIVVTLPISPKYVR